MHINFILLPFLTIGTLVLDQVFKLFSMEEFPSLKKKHFSLRFHYLLKAFLEMLMRIKNKQIQLKIIY